MRNEEKNQFQFYVNIGENVNGEKDVSVTVNEETMTRHEAGLSNTDLEDTIEIIEDLMDVHDIEMHQIHIKNDFSDENAIAYLASIKGVKAEKIYIEDLEELGWEFQDIKEAQEYLESLDCRIEIGPANDYIIIGEGGREDTGNREKTIQDIIQLAKNNKCNVKIN